MSKSETAWQLFLRLGVKHSVDGLDASFFKAIAKGLCPGDSVELYGEEGCGKTELLIHFCVRCILPKQWKFIDISDKEANVIFIDTDYKFPLWRIVDILENTLRVAYKNIQNNTERSSMNTSETNEFVKSCLERLYIVKCSSSYNLSKTLIFVESLLHENPDICLITIDSMSAFFWTDRATGGENRSQQELNQRVLIRSLKELQERYHVVIVATKCAIMNPNYQTVSNSAKNAKTSNIIWKHDQYLSQDWNRFVTYRFLIRKHQDVGNSEIYSSILLEDPAFKECRYVIIDSGIEFLEK